MQAVLDKLRDRHAVEVGVPKSDAGAEFETGAEFPRVRFVEVLRASGASFSLEL